MYGQPAYRVSVPSASAPMVAACGADAAQMPSALLRSAPSPGRFDDAVQRD